jgi:hypothetical protein
MSRTSDYLRTQSIKICHIDVCQQLQFEAGHDSYLFMCETPNCLLIGGSNPGLSDVSYLPKSGFNSLEGNLWAIFNKYLIQIFPMYLEFRRTIYEEFYLSLMAKLIGFNSTIMAKMLNE